MSDLPTARLTPAGRPAPDTPPPGHTLPAVPAPGRVGDYQLVREVGRGGMGVVYEAFDPRLRRRAAVKMPLPHLSGDALPRFQTEAEAMALLAHPHIVGIHAIGWHAGRPFVACEYLPGGSLLARTGNKPQPPRAAAGTVQALAGAVAHAHARGVVHRDLKPANVLYDGAGRPKLTDFGVARLEADAAGGGLTKVGQVIGTPQYMAPEQARGGPDGGRPAVDVYALGAVLYHLLTGRPPHDGPDGFDILQRVVQDDPVPPRRLVPGVPRDLETVCLKALDKHPGRRYRTADDLLADLGRFLAGEPVRARSAGPLRRAMARARRRPLVAGLLSGLVLVAAAGAGGVGWQWRHAVAARDQAEGNAIAAVGSAADAEAAAGREQAARADAERQRDAAERERDRAERHLYASQVTTAARQIETGDAHHARALLAAAEQSPRHAAARGWEWHHVRRLATPYVWRVALAADGGLWGHALAVNPAGTRVATCAGDPYQNNYFWDRDQPCHLSLRPTGLGVPSRTLRAVLPERAEQAVWVSDTRLAVCGVSGTLAVVDDVADGKVWRPATPPAFCSRDPALCRISPCGRWAARGSGRGELTVFDLRPATPTSHTLTPRPGVPAAVLAFAPDGLLAVRVGRADRPGELLLVEPAGGRVRGTVPGVSERAAFSPDGRRVAAHLGRRGDRGLGVWDAADGSPVWVAREKDPGHRLLAGFTPDGKHLLEAHSADTRMRVWDAAGGQVRFDLVGHTGPITDTAFGPDGRFVASGSNDGSARVWDLRDGSEVAAFRGHVNGVRRLVFAPGGDRLFTAGMDASLAAWDLTRERADGGRLPPLDPADPAGGPPPKGREPAYLGGLWVAADGAGWVLDTARGRLTRFDPAAFTPTHAATPAGLLPRVSSVSGSFHLSADGRRLVGAVGPYPTRPAVWDTAGGAEVGRPPELPPMVVSGAAATADGRRAAVVGFARATRPDTVPPSVLAVWEPDAGRAVRVEVGGADLYASAAFLPDGRLALGRVTRPGHPGGVDLLDPDTGTRTRLTAPTATKLITLAVSADGRRVAGVCSRRQEADGMRVLCWDTAGGGPRWEAGEVGPAVGLSFCPTGDRLAVARYDDRLTLLRADTGEPAFRKVTASYRFGDYAYPAKAVFTPDARHLLAVQSDGRLSVWAAHADDGNDDTPCRVTERHAEATGATFAFHLRAAAELAGDPAGVGFRLHAAALDRLPPPNAHVAAGWAALRTGAGER